MSEVQEQNGATSDLCDLIQYIASQLVEHPDAINIEADQRGQMVRVHLTVHADDMGRVIGREGRIARAMRTLLMIAASRRGLRSSLDIDS